MALLQFPHEHYAADVEATRGMARDEVIAALRRSSTGFSRGSSKYRGVTRHHPYGKWEARIGRIRGQVSGPHGQGLGKMHC